MGEEGELVRVEDTRQRRCLREQGLRIAVSAVGVALVLTAAFLLLSPG